MNVRPTSLLEVFFVLVSEVKENLIHKFTTQPCQPLQPPTNTQMDRTFYKGGGPITDPQSKRSNYQL